MRAPSSLRPSLALAPALALALVAAGCVTPALDAPGAPVLDAARADLLATLRASPAPALDAAANVAWLEKFVGAHSPRLSGTPGEKAAADDLAAQLKKLGYTVERHFFGANGLPSADGPFQAVVGVKKGASLPDELIILGAHYDTAPIGTAHIPPIPLGPPPVEAAYDNGSGTAMVMELARLLATVPTARTVQFAFFNGEEEGLVASGAYAKALAARGADVKTYVGFDMVGINWPSAAGCLCIYSGEKFAADLNPLQETVAFDLLGYPRSNETVQVLDNHKTRNSDEGAFQSVGFPTMRWAGLKSAGLYWGYHKLNDTMETMVKQAGSKELLVQGFETTAASAYYTVIALDAQREALPTR